MLIKLNFVNIKSLRKGLIMVTMKSTRHDMLREQWRAIIKKYKESGLPVKAWCEENHISATQYYYWLRVIREESLIKAGTLATTKQVQFTEIKPVVNNAPNHQGKCAILRLHGHEIEVQNGADPNTLEMILRILGKS